MNLGSSDDAPLIDLGDATIVIPTKISSDVPKTQPDNDDAEELF